MCRLISAGRRGEPWLTPLPTVPVDLVAPFCVRTKVFLKAELTALWISFREGIRYDLWKHPPCDQVLGWLEVQRSGAFWCLICLLCGGVLRSQFGFPDGSVASSVGAVLFTGFRAVLHSTTFLRCDKRAKGRSVDKEVLSPFCKWALLWTLGSLSAFTSVCMHLPHSWYNIWLASMVPILSASEKETSVSVDFLLGDRSLVCAIRFLCVGLHGVI